MKAIRNPAVHIGLFAAALIFSTAALAQDQGVRRTPRGAPGGSIRSADRDRQVRTDRDARSADRGGDERRIRRDDSNRPSGVTERSLDRDGIRRGDRPEISRDNRGLGRDTTIRRGDVRRSIRDRDPSFIRRAGRDRDRDIVIHRDLDRDIHVRRVIRPGTRLTYLPSGHRHVHVHGRDYYRIGDTFYLSLSVGPRVEYVVARPPIGVVVEYLPYGYERLIIDGHPYYYHDDVYYVEEWFEDGPAYVVVEPPVHGYIAYLPPQHEVVVVRGERFYRVDRHYYRPVHRGNDLFYLRVNLDLD